MANVVINDTNLTNIADAIREKNGLTDKYKPSEMAAAILAISSSGGGSSLEIPTKVEMEQGYFNYYGCWDWLLEQLDELIIKVRPQGGSAKSAFYFSKLEDMSHLTLINDGSSLGNVFERCNRMKELPKFRHTAANTVSSLASMFNGCDHLRNIPNDFFTHKNADGSKASDNSIFSSSSSVSTDYLFASCFSLREIPSFPGLNKFTTMMNMFKSCNSLNQLVGLPVNINTAWTSDKFYSTFDDCFRLSRLTFETNANGTAKTAQWSNQTIDLSKNVGVVSSLYTSRITGYNSGITEDKRVVSGEDYARLKDDPDWWTTNTSFSRYSHDAAVETLNSLPDTSDYIISKGGTNIIKFSGDYGELSGGYIKNLTASEIAVATVKGWTVTLV